MLTKLVLCSAITATLFSGYALADNAGPVTPINYIVAITPNTESMRIAGTETITLNMAESTNKIQFNSTNQKLCHVRFDGQPVHVVESNSDKQLTTITLKEPANAGQHSLTFSFVGNIERDLHGMFVQPYAKRNGVKGQFLTATFEGSDTQRIFPGWDQTSYSAPVQLSITVPSTWAAWASMPIEHKETHGEFTTIAFKSISDLGSNLIEFSGGSLLQSNVNIAAKN